MQGWIEIGELVPGCRHRRFSRTVGIDNAYFSTTPGAPCRKTLGAGLLPADDDHSQRRRHLTGFFAQGACQHMPVSCGQADPCNAMLLAG